MQFAGAALRRLWHETAGPTRGLRARRRPAPLSGSLRRRGRYTDLPRGPAAAGPCSGPSAPGGTPRYCGASRKGWSTGCVGRRRRAHQFHHLLLGRYLTTVRYPAAGMPAAAMDAALWADAALPRRAPYLHLLGRRALLIKGRSSRFRIR